MSVARTLQEEILRQKGKQSPSVAMFLFSKNVKFLIDCKYDWDSVRYITEKLQEINFQILGEMKNTTEMQQKE